MQLVWLASFPKSGNTWARFLLYQYLHGEASSSAQLAAEIPDVHAPGEFQRAAAKPGRTRLIVKTHFMCVPTVQGERFIYLVRHPRDVLQSVMNFVRLLSDNTPYKNLSDEQYARMFIQAGRNPLNLQAEYGTIEQHWHSWLDQARLPGIVVRYEDLKADALGGLRRMLEWIGEPVDESRARRAVELSGFDRMRALEVREKSAGKEGTVFFGARQKVREGVLFMNKGQSGRSLDRIAPGLDALCDARFKETLERFGYASGSPK